MAIDHVSLATTLMKETCRFFNEILQFDSIPTPATIPVSTHWFEISKDQTLHVFEADSSFEVSSQGEFQSHFAIRFPQARWLRIQSQLEKHNIEIIGTQQENGVSRFFVHDPNGYCLEFIRG